MNTYQKEEKFLKASLKKRISFNLQTLIKFLITGVVAVFVTACGGGGGGSSASTPSNPIDKNTGNITESVTAEDKTYINEGSIEVKNRGESSYALAGKNSKIVNENRISITEGDKNTFGKIVGSVSGIDELDNLLNQGYNVGVFAQGGNVVNGEKGQINVESKKGIGIYLSGAKLENNGNINMKGKFQVNEQGIIGSENIGVWANNGSEAINNGEIILNTIIDDTVYKGNYPLELPYSIGMFAENGSNIENKNLIKGTGNLIGMSVTSNSLGVNNGEISLSSGKINSDVTFEEGEYYKYNYDKFFYTDVIGMKAVGEGSKVVNNKNIKINGKGTGMVANDGATGINNGNISMTSGEIHKKGYSESSSGNGYDNYELVKSWAEVIGMSADNGDIENGLNGTISIDGNGKGMYGINNSNLVNNGTITVNGKFEYATPTFTDGEEIPSNYEWSSSLNAIGMEIVNGGKAENNGQITINTEYYQKEYLYDGNKKGYLYLDYYSAGIRVNNSIGLNGEKGIIEVKGSTAGMLGQNGAKLENNGSIILAQGTPITNEGKEYFETVGMVGNNSEIINNGNIISKDGIITDRVIGIYSEKGKVQNSGSINIKGEFVIGIEGIESNITNDNNIILNGKYVSGILAENGEVINNELISIESQNPILSEGLPRSYSSAIEVENGKITNNGTVIGNGNNIVGLDGYNSEILNENKIELTGSALTGIYTHQGGSGINNGDITINVTENSDVASSGISLEGAGKVENNGTININGNKVVLSAGGTNLNELVKKISAGIKVENIGEFPQENMIVNSSKGIINISGSGMGIYAKNSKVENAGTINLIEGEFADNEVTNLGMVINGGEGVNSGKILGGNNSSAGMMTFNDGTIINDEQGVIDLKGNDVEGMTVSSKDTGTVINRGKIKIEGNGVNGIDVEGGTGENYGTITVIGQEANGMEVDEDNGSITNNGEIIVINKIKNNSNNYDNYGMRGEADNVELVNTNKITLDIISDTTSTNGKIYRNIGMGVYGNNSIITNSGEITINNEKNPYGVSGIGLFAKGSDNTVLNDGTININGNIIKEQEISDEYGNIKLEEVEQRISTGIKVKGSLANRVVNEEKGVINLKGSSLGIHAIETNLENKGKINFIKTDSLVEGTLSQIGMLGFESEIINSGFISGEIDNVTGMIGINSNLINSGTIDITGNNTEGMSISNYIGSNGTANNSGTIKLTGNDTVAMEIDGENGSGNNSGTINIIGNNSIGMRADLNNLVTNKKDGNIIVIGDSSVGMRADADEGSSPEEVGEAINEVGATIIVSGDNSVGMEADGGIAINNGTINVGTGAYGMLAEAGGTAINNGTIEVTAGALGGMIAKENGVISNNGTINIDKSLGEEKALIAEGNGKIENKGTINADGTVSIEVGGTYTVGTNSDGTFGKLTASDVDLNGNLVISTDMVAGTYEESYKLDNIIEGENINLGEEYKNLSNSLLYDAKTSKDEEGNLDGELVRNDNSISDFTSDNLTQVGELFDKYLAKENYETLSQEDKKLVDKIFASTSSANEIKNAMNNLVGPEHLNISRQIFDIKDSFRKYDTSVISTLDKYNHNFILIGEYGDIQSKDEVVGYDTKMTGFNGAMRLADNLYGTLGYGYSDIEYDNNSESKIQTIHGAIYKDYGYNKSNIRVGVFGEYNFHETDREDLDGYVNTDYNSYLVGVTGEISKKYGDNLYIQPRLALDAVYGNVENFSEKSLEIKEQDYTSILPKAELIVGKKLNNIGLFAKSSYSYELGNLDKDMDIKLLNNTVGIDNDTMDKGNLDLSIGTEFNFESLSLNAELGKEFGKRDREYIKAGIIYKF